MRQRERYAENVRIGQRERDSKSQIKRISMQSLFSSLIRFFYTRMRKIGKIIIETDLLNRNKIYIESGSERSNAVVRRWAW